ncbi:MAG: hypothetical protein M0Z85_03855 [Gammaproteobacteria bacterium]|nr:hypothetical protein [Gammaproteobacteria bacterium]
MKTRIFGTFRDSHPDLTVRLRPMFDLRDPRQAHRYKRRRECAVRIPSKLIAERW